MTSLADGQKIPAFIANATGGQQLTPANLIGTKTVFYFYPKDHTPGCTQEGQDFRDAFDDFKQAGCQIFGISRDSLKTHENFRQKQDFPFHLISDTDETLCRLFDVIKLKKLYGKEYLGIERSTFLIDTEGKLAKSWRKVGVKGHVAEVLEACRSL